MVRASVFKLVFVSGDFTQFFVARLRQAMAVCSRVLDCLDSLRNISLCHWSNRLLRQPYLVMNLQCSMIMLITYSSSYASSVCGGVDGYLLRYPLSAKCLAAIWLTELKSELGGPAISLALRCMFCSIDCVCSVVRAVDDL